MPRSYRLPFLIAVLMVQSCSLPCFADRNPLLKGKVVDQQGAPVKGAKIICRNIDGGHIVTGSSDGHGAFVLEHLPCNHMSFKVIPPMKTSLTSARFESVPGDSNKQFIVQLHRGFFVRGKVTGGNKGLKGLKLKFIAADIKNKDEAVHGGAEATTDSTGDFSVVLTPGQKQIEIHNTRYPQWQEVTRQQCQITDDASLPEIKLSPAPNLAHH